MTAPMGSYELATRARSTSSDDAHRDWFMLLPAAAELAKVVAGTDFVPKSLRDKPAAITAAILYGDELGLGPMQSLAKIHVVDGRPTLSAEAQRALIYEAGHELWLEESSSSKCTWAGRRSGTDVTGRATWTMEDARRANLAGKLNWRTYPRAMLSARASAELARAMFADVIGGLIASEELDDGASSAAAELGDTAESPGGATRRRTKRRTSAPELVPPPVATITETPTPEPVAPIAGEAGTDRMSDAQQRRMFGLFRDRGYKQGSRAARLAYASAVIDRNIGSASELTADEAAAIIRALETDSDEVGAPEESAPESDSPPTGDEHARGSGAGDQPELL